MLRFSFPESLVPPGMYQAVMPDGTIIKQAARAVWFQEIKNHYRRNDLILPENWRSHYEDQCCKLLGPGFCVNELGQTVNMDDIHIGLKDLQHGMTVLWSISRSPDPLVDKTTAVERAAICAACPANIHVPGCKPCIQLANTILDIKGRGSTPADAHLRVCGICKCSAEAHVWVKTEILAKGVDGVQLRRMEEINPDCWKYKAINGLSSISVES